MKYHYTYRITNINPLNTKKYYYGVRTSKCIPQEDIGVKYFSSSKDKQFKKDQKNNPIHYKYKVIRIFETRELAETYEAILHDKFEVGINLLFYNRTKAAENGYSMLGVKHSDETKKKMSKAHQGKKLSDEHKKNLKGMKGKRHTEKTKKKMSETRKGIKYSDETKRRMSAGKKGKKHSVESRKNMSNGQKGRKHSQETKKKMSKTMKGIKRKTSICPHCNKEGGGGAMKQWHFDNCKFK